MPRKHNRHQQGGRLVIRQAAVGHSRDKEVDGGAVERTAVPLLTYEIDRPH
jgi:hypothetical protein